MRRYEAIDKLSGREVYVDDIPAAGVWWGATVRSPVPRGLIREIRFDPAFDFSDFVIVDHRDIPGANVVALIEDDQPVLAADRVRHIHEAVLLLAHPDRDRLRAARRAIEIVVDEEPGLFDFLEEPTAETLQHGSDNVFSRVCINKGDVEAALAAAPRVIEGEYRTGAQEHVYLENQGMLATVDDGVVTVRGSLQCPYYIQQALTKALGLPDDQVRVVQAATGGGFGGKEEYPSVIATHAALLTMKAGRPVKLLYDRDEDMAVTTKRHPAWVQHRTGVTDDGKLLAQDIDVVLDGGAYVTLSPVVLSRGVIHAAGPYVCDHVRVDGRVKLTNSVPFGAFRGFGAPQTIFACERHLDVVAKELGICPIELRRMNLIADGDSTATEHVIEDGVDRIAVLDRALEESEYLEREKAHAELAATHPYLRRGMGFATFFHGAGFTGSGETMLKSQVEIAGLPDGTIEVRTANVEMGQGATTAFTKIVAETLDVNSSQVQIAEVDTARVPDSGPTVASRTTMIVGGLVERGAKELAETVGGAHGDDLRDAIVAWHRQNPERELICRVQYEPPPAVEWDDKNYRGAAYGTYAWATYVAEVEVDLRMGDVRVVDFVAVQDVGTVIDHVLASGQVQGGVVQAIGWALMEECQYDRGAMKNANLTNYSIPTTADLPPIRVFFEETPYPYGARGAKGIGELPLDGGAPAVLNAIANAIGCDPRVVPFTPERVLDEVTR